MAFTRRRGANVRRDGLLCVPVRDDVCQCPDGDQVLRASSVGACRCVFRTGWVRPSCAVIHKATIALVG